MSSLVAKKVFFTRGTGRGQSELRSFEEALRDGGIAPYNIVGISSIFPPFAETVTRDRVLNCFRPVRYYLQFLLEIPQMNLTG